MLLSCQVDVYIYMYITCYIYTYGWVWIGYDYIFLFIYFYILPNHISMVSCENLSGFYRSGCLVEHDACQRQGTATPQKCECIFSWPRKTCKTIDSRHRYCMNIDSHVHIKKLMHVLLSHVIAMYTYMYVYVFSACTIPYVADAW